MQNLTNERAKHPKNTYYNLLYKFIANAGIGQMARGLNHKTSFDTKSGTNIPMTAGPLINPLYGGWITAFVRTTLAEIMNNIHRDGGKIISCTTFITDMKDLENYSVEGVNGEFARMYKEARHNLIGRDQPLLEVKYIEELGVIS